MHYYKRNFGDYYTKAGRLTMIQHGAYTLLLDACYDREQFPTKEEAIEWCWANTQEEISAVEYVLNKFFDLSEDGRYVQARIEAEVEKYRDNAAINSAIAKEREQKRRDKKHEPCTESARTVHEPPRSKHEPPPNQEPRTSNQEPVTTNQEPRTSISLVAVEVIHELSTLTGVPFDASKKYCGFLNARIKEGATLEQLLGVVRVKHSKWGNDPKTREWLNPETLFRPNNFEKYLLEVSPSGEFKTPETEMQRATRKVLEEIGA